MNSVKLMAWATIGVLSLQPELIDVEEILRLPNRAPTARIPYGDDPLQFGDLRLPEKASATKAPVVVVVHGGCWRSLYNIDHIGALSAALTQAGVATWTLEYRRVGDPGGGWPGTFRDVSEGVDYLRELEKTYPLDLDRVVALGHSAGGHLVLWLGARAKLRDPVLSGDDPLPLSGVISLAGVDDLKRALEEGVCGDMAAQLVGGTPRDVPDRYPKTSPIELLPTGTRQHLINGARDPIVPVAFGRAYAAAGAKAGDEVELTVLDEAGHFELIAPFDDAFIVVRDAALSMLSP